MSEPVKYGEEWKLTVRKSPKDSAMPATAATRIHRPTSTPSPMATSPRAMTSPTVEAMGTRWEIRAWMGLEREAPTSWAWIEVGLAFSRNWGLASFWSPAKRKVTPRKSRSGRRNHPVATVPSGLVTDHMFAGGRPLSGVTGPRSSRATIQAASPDSGIARSGRRGPLPR